MSRTTNPQRNSGRRRRASNRLPLILGIAGVALIAIAIVLVLAEDSAAADPEAITLLDGGSVRIEDYAGQTVLVNFWATWCPPCKAEMPELEAYYQDYRDQGFTMLAVNSGDPAEMAEGFIERAGYSFPVGVDPDGRTSQAFGVNGLPTSIIYGPDGEVVYRHVGAISREVLEAEVTPLLAGAAGG
jgi:thiol-disulfide isomerase/thioredoxin